MTKIQLPTQDFIEKESKILRKMAIDRYPEHKEIEFVLALLVKTNNSKKILYNIQETSTAVIGNF